MSGQANHSKRDWNELEFVSWKEFQQMAPSIIQLEITRLGKLIQSFRLDSDLHNALVQARFELKQFIRHLAATQKAAGLAGCTTHLQNALLALALITHPGDAQAEETLCYIRDRIEYIYQRIHFIY